MAAAVAWIVDETSSRKRTGELRLELVSERITARELIRRRVEVEVARFRQVVADRYQGLVRPDPKSRRIDLAKQQQVALEAFGRNGFLLFAGDRQITDLDEEIVITPELPVRFVKLVPLVGG
jgi:hypothetical protein